MISIVGSIPTSATASRSSGVPAARLSRKEEGWVQFPGGPLRRRTALAQAVRRPRVTRFSGSRASLLVERPATWIAAAKNCRSGVGGLARLLETQKALVRLQGAALSICRVRRVRETHHWERRPGGASRGLDAPLHNLTPMVKRTSLLASTESFRVQILVGVNGDACTKARRDSLARNLDGFDSHRLHYTRGSWSNGTTPARHAGNPGSIPRGSTSLCDVQIYGRIASQITILHGCRKIL